MSEAEYKEGQARLVLAAQILESVDLAGMLVQIGETEAVAPFADPTLWIRGHADLERVKRLVEAAMPLWHEVRRQIRAELEQKAKSAAAAAAKSEELTIIR